MDTIKDGRFDIVIFPNGGWECIGKMPSTPETPEDMYWQKVLDFVGQHQGLEAPQKYTGFYSVKGETLKMSWAPYAGEMPREEVPLYRTIPNPIDSPMEEPEDADNN